MAGAKACTQVSTCGYTVRGLIGLALYDLTSILFHPENTRVKGSWPALENFLYAMQRTLGCSA